jgi:hypothetical protein
MGDRKPKKTSSGTNAAHKAKEAKVLSDRFAALPKSEQKDKGKKK